MSEPTIGQYRIRRKLGEGGVGEVFEALDPMLGRTVAVKRLRPELSSREDVLERFRSEAKTLAQLNHPNIATLYSFERDCDALFMVMEYVEGETLAHRLRRSGAQPLEAALSIFAQALEGIGYAHASGIVHRDIKASNLIVRPDHPSKGSVKVMDFGIARMLGSERVTQLGQLVGTPDYMAPEQIRGEEIDARADIYALGALLYGLLVGRLPFQGKSDFELMRAHIEAAPPPLVGEAADHPGLDDIIHRALAKNPEDRFQDTAALRAALEPFAPELFAAEAIGAEDTPSPAPATPATLEGTREATRVFDDEASRTGVAAPRVPATADPTIDFGEPGEARADAPTTTLQGGMPRMLWEERKRPARPGGSRLAVVAALLVGLNVLWVSHGPLPAASVDGAAESSLVAARAMGTAATDAGEGRGGPEAGASTLPVPPGSLAAATDSPTPGPATEPDSALSPPPRPADGEASQAASPAGSPLPSRTAEAAGAQRPPGDRSGKPERERALVPAEPESRTGGRQGDAGKPGWVIRRQ